jgi:L-iditol 2-dehydrogenase
MVLEEVELIGNRANPNTALPTIEMLKNGRIDLTPLLTHRFPLRDFAEALDTFESRRGGAIKVATKPNGMS